jgi:hypothetical protein
MAATADRICDLRQAAPAAAADRTRDPRQAAPTAVAAASTTSRAVPLPHNNGRTLCFDDNRRRSTVPPATVAVPQYLNNAY